jgi:hypothetical protein
MACCSIIGLSRWRDCVLVRCVDFVFGLVCMSPPRCRFAVVFAKQIVRDPLTQAREGVGFACGVERVGWRLGI